jgi:hypothetical protein
MDQTFFFFFPCSGVASSSWASDRGRTDLPRALTAGHRRHHLRGGVDRSTQHLADKLLR